MKYVELPYVTKKISRIFFGTANEPFQSGGDGNELLDAAFAAGINAIDTARVYGLAEKSIGNWMEARGNREEIVLLSKCGHFDMATKRKRVNEKEMREDFAVSTGYLKTDYIDIYLLHRDDPEVPAGEIVEIFNALHAEGKIGAFGGSNWTHQRIEEANEYAYSKNLIPFTVSSPNFGLAEQVTDIWGGGCVSISGPQNAQARAWYIKNNMPAIAYSSLARGLFSGKIDGNHPETASEVMDADSIAAYGTPDNFERLRRCQELAAKYNCTVPQMAMAWMYNQPVPTFALANSTKAKRIEENVKAVDIELTEAEVKYLNLEA